MSLVAAYSGSSDEESDNDSDTPNPVSVPVKPGSSTGLNLPAPRLFKDDAGVSKSGSSGMFSALPAPKKEVVLDVEEDDSDIVIPSKPPTEAKECPPAKQKVKISIPSLSDFKDDEDSAPRNKKMRPTPKGSGLLAILPEPKNSVLRPSKAMVPHVLTKRPPAKPAIPSKKPVSNKTDKKPSGYPESDDESGDEGGDHASAIDFFSLTGNCAPEPAEINLEELLPPRLGPIGKPTPPQSRVQVPAIPQVDTSEPEHQHSESQQELLLDDEALRQLCGRRAHRGAEEVNIIELHGDNMMPDPKEWMLKQMTEEQESHAHKSSQPSSAHRRKHQITYLAFQAKEREIELKNQWAQNRMTKKQTQAKYGF